MTNFLTGFPAISAAAAPAAERQTQKYSQPNVQGNNKAASPLSVQGEQFLPSAENNGQNGKIKGDADKKRRFDSFECQTCKNRRYQDGSDDMGVSFQTPTKVNPKAAAAAVRGHEQEHVTRNRAKAKREGKEIVSQSVTIHTGICPECGKIFVSGGTTRTATRSSSEDKNNSERFNIGLSDPENENGNMLNAVA